MSAIASRETYDAWNSAIQREFFDGSWRDRPIYLDLEDDVLARIARAAGGDGTDAEGALVRAVKPTLYLYPERERIFTNHVRRARMWLMTGATDSPPFLAVLALLSVVAEKMRSDEQFRASNYYDRLCQTLDIDPQLRAARAKVVRDFVDTHVLWDALNSWLSDAEGHLGLPTAFAFDYRVHVGVPLSQALVRAGDRERLKDFFAEYRLTPGQRISRSDMARLLADWVPSSPLSAGLRTLWQRAEAQERIADVACVELEAWDGTAHARLETRDVEGLVRVVGSLRRQPRLRLHLGVLVRESPLLPPGRYVVPDDASPQAIAAFASSGGAVTLSDRADDGWRSLIEAGTLSMPDLLAANLLLRSVGEERAALRREPRRLVVLEHDDEHRRYVEVGRSQLGQDALLLAHQSIDAVLEPLLAQIARPGFSKHGGDLPGLPQDWVAYSGVEIIGIAETESPDLASLVPLSWTQVSIGGGLALPGHSTWLRQRPAELRLAALAESDVSCALSSVRSLNGSGVEDQDLGMFSGTQIVTLKELALPDGDYRVVLSDRSSGRRGSVLAHASFRLRSADHPRLLLGDLGGVVASDFAVESSWASLSGRRMDTASAASVSGAAVGQLEAGRAGSRSPVPASLGRIERFDLETEEDEEPLGNTTMRSSTPGCLVGGAHHWMLESIWPGQRPQRVDATCRNCGLERWFPARPRRRADGVATGRPHPRQAPIATVVMHGAEARPIEPDEQIDQGLVLEALCYSQQGSWSTFERLAAHDSDAPWFAVETGRLLSSLGHIDLVLDRRSLRPVFWSVAPTTVASLPSDASAVLCGYRSERLLARLADDVMAIGGHFGIEADPRCPPRVLVTGLEVDDLEAICDSAASALGTPVAFAEAPALHLAQALDPLRTIGDSLPAFLPPVGVGIERFDFDRNRWHAVADIDEAGAYRFLTRPIRYGFVGRVDLSRRQPLVADNRLAKWLAAAELGVALLAYDERQETLVCRLGAQLPGLFERAAVLCSGQPPLQRTDGTVVYRDVPEEVASGLWRALGPP